MSTHHGRVLRHAQFLVKMYDTFRQEDPGNWGFRGEKQTLRDALESLVRHGLILQYDLAELTIVSLDGKYHTLKGDGKWRTSTEPPDPTMSG